MRRLALLLVLAVGMALPAGALAKAPTFRGKLKGGGRVAFELKRNERGERKVAHWRWHDLRIACENHPGDEFRHSGRFGEHSMPVRMGSFGDQLYSEAYGNTATVAGSFKNWRHATGTLELTGNTVWGNACHSGSVDWSADRI